MSQEECSQIESDLKKYLENGQKLDKCDENQVQLKKIDPDGTGLYIEEQDNEGNYIRGKLPTHTDLFDMSI